MSQCQNVSFFMQNSRKSRLNNGLRTEQIVVQWHRLRQESACLCVFLLNVSETERLLHHKNAYRSKTSIKCILFSEKV